MLSNKELVFFSRKRCVSNLIIFYVIFCIPQAVAVNKLPISGVGIAVGLLEYAKGRNIDLEFWKCIGGDNTNVNSGHTVSSLKYNF